MSSIRNLRWYVCGLILLGVVVNYIDRQAFTILETSHLRPEFKWDSLEYSRLVNSFQISYAIMTLLTGWLLDRIGTRWGLALAIIWWSLAEIGHAFARSLTGFGIARFALGAGEAASLPGSVKVIGEWFPKSERATAMGYFNAAVAVGAAVAPLIIPYTAAAFGWQGTFIVTGALGLLWLVLWLWLFDIPETHKRITPEERHMILSDRPPTTKATVSWWKLMRHKQLWAYAGARILTDPAYWFFTYWTPQYFNATFGINGVALVPYLTTAFAMSGVGSVVGGSLSSALIRRGWTVNRARKTAMFALSACIPFVIYAQSSKNPWTSALLIGMAIAVHQGWAANNFSLVLDLFPAKASGTAFGIGGCLGLLSGVAVAEYAGRILRTDPSYFLPMFIFAGTVYFLGTLWIHLLAPRLEPAKID